MQTTIGSILVIIFLFLAGIHIYWGFGGKWGYEAAIPTTENNEKLMSPKLKECMVVAIALLILSVLVLIKSGIITYILPNWIQEYGICIILILFMIRAIGDFKYVGFFKKVKTTKFAQMDTKYFSPLCLLISLLAITLALTA
ncbi:DUF3995 domain-containing protein [Flavobacterium hydatis]|uniref:DUF3995 domain-containing protein n=1 Tax=Flavobacterium hydatis TaxID=991 RepID=A0A086A2D5_FLAHY|nr:DUF3995 domain-containing protein [Flavobacterium hydatis]KFF10849.1 hypothetical protein IW20_20390 [Flavobacterium hydatis]OXA94512.1 hypothetical protein B0A62_09945 [Flavobacterium hydatis]